MKKRGGKMSLTFEDVKEKLKKLDEVTLLEILEISSEEIVERFEDKIESKQDYFITDLGSEEWEDED
jgi:hypothetical protein